MKTSPKQPHRRQVWVLCDVTPEGTAHACTARPPYGLEVQLDKPTDVPACPYAGTWDLLRERTSQWIEATLTFPRTVAMADPIDSVPLTVIGGRAFDDD